MSETMRLTEAEFNELWRDYAAIGNLRFATLLKRLITQARPSPTDAPSREQLARVIYTAMEKAEADEDGTWPTYDDNVRTGEAMGRPGAGNVYFIEANRAADECLAIMAAGRGAADVLAERKRQIEAEGWTPDHDDRHQDGALALAAASYASALEPAAEKLIKVVPHHYDHNGRAQCDDVEWSPVGSVSVHALWPWDGKWWKPGRPWNAQDKRRNLVKAGALILAEIERLDRITPATAEGRE